MSMRYTILGCGSSPGVPRIGNDWGACDPNNPKNRRSRCSLLVEKIGPDGITKIIVDTSPDFREQCLRAEIDWADAILYTHAHADHIHGIDDLRAFVINRKKRVNIYADQATLDRLYSAFGYCFETPKGSSYPPILDAHLIVPGKEVKVDGPGGVISVIPILQQHGAITSLGFKFDKVAYSPDISKLPDISKPLLQNLDYWIVDALRYEPHPSHFSKDEAVAAINELKPKQAILTHLHIDLDFKQLTDELPAYITPAYDGLSFTI